jgi:plasmid maintenance system antidote protein VapI
MRKITRKPTHPGNILREDYLTPLSIKASELNIRHKFGEHLCFL